MGKLDDMRDHECGAYPREDTCSRCEGITDRGMPGVIQGVWYKCRECGYSTLVIDWCECGEDDADE